MKLIIVLAALAILTGSASNAQTENKEKKHPVFLGLHLFGGSGKVFYDQPFPEERPGILNFDRKEKNTDFRLGVDVKVKLTEHLRLCSGLTYIKEKKFWYYSDYYSPLVTVKEIFIRTGLPVRIEARTGKKKVSPFLTLGVMPTFRLHDVQVHQAYYQGLLLTSGEILVKNSNGRFETQFQIGGGLDVSVDRLVMQVFPLYEFSFWTRGYKEFNHTLGLALSLSYRL